MQSAAFSVKVFGMYLVVVGAGLIAAPALVLAPLGIAEPTEIWIRVVGALTLVLSYYYLTNAAGNVTPFLAVSVRARMLFALLAVLLVAIYHAPVQLLLFGAVDVAGALWTFQALKESARSA